MLLPATQYILLHSFATNTIKSMIRRSPLPQSKRIRRDIKALKHMDSFCLNGGYVPSYVETNKDKYVPMVNWQWYAESKEGIPGSVRQSGGGIGKLDAANEDGFFFKLNKARLKKLKQLLKEKGELKDKATPPDKKI